MSTYTYDALKEALKARGVPLFEPDPTRSTRFFTFLRSECPTLKEAEDKIFAE